MYPLSNLLARWRSRPSGQACRAPRGSFQVLIFLLFCWPAALHAAAWEQAVRIAYLRAGAPIPDQDFTAALDYAIAAWSARLDVQLSYTDAEAAPGYQKGLVVIRWIDALEMVQGGSDILSVATTKRWLYAKSGYIAGAEILLRRDNVRLRDAACLKHVLVHELGHALGLTHLAVETSIMYPSLDSCHHTLTADDIAAAPYPQHICHAELLPDFDIYIPVINIDGLSWSARLTYRQGYWAVTESQPTVPRPGCDDSSLETDTLVLDKVWTQQHMWQAELEKVEERWRLKYAR